MNLFVVEEQIQINFVAIVCTRRVGGGGGIGGINSHDISPELIRHLYRVMYLYTQIFSVVVFSRVFV